MATKFTDEFTISQICRFNNTLNQFLVTSSKTVAYLLSENANPTGRDVAITYFISKALLELAMFLLGVQFRSVALNPEP